MKYAVEMGSGAMIYIQNFIKIHKDLTAGGYADSMEIA
jgi:hypothetical protein